MAHVEEEVRLSLEVTTVPPLVVSQASVPLNKASQDSIDMLNLPDNNQINECSFTDFIVSTDRMIDHGASRLGSLPSLAFTNGALT